MSLPRAARQFVKLLPIAFVPGRHFVHAARCSLSHTFFDAALDAKTTLKVASKGPYFARQIPVGCKCNSTGPLAGDKPANDIRPRRLDETFRRLLFQTRYRVKCFAYRTLATAARASHGTGRVTCRSVCSREAAEMRVYTTRIFTYLPAKTNFARGLRRTSRGGRASCSRPVFLGFERSTSGREAT
jgi:hypothetical protein